MTYSPENELVTTWLMAGGGIILVFSIIACLRIFAREHENRISKTTALIGFWMAFYGAFMDHRLAGLW